MTLGLTPTMNLRIHRGSDFYIPVEIETSLMNALSESTIAGWTFTMTIRDTDSLSSTFNQSISGTIVDANQYRAQFFITDTINEVFPVGMYKHDMWRVNTDKEFCLAEGTYEVLTNRRVP